MTPFIVGAVTNAKLNPVVMIACVMIVIGLFPIKFITETLNKGEEEVEKEDPTTASSSQSILTDSLTKTLTAN